MAVTIKDLAELTDAAVELATGAVNTFVGGVEGVTEIAPEKMVELMAAAMAWHDAGDRLGQAIAWIVEKDE